MREYTRRTVLCGTVGTAGLLAGCTDSSSSGSIIQTAVEDQQLIIEFEESLEAEKISVIDPGGESFAETSVSAGATRVTFDIEMPYTPGEYRIIAADDGETLAETSQEIRPELEIVDVGVGANHMDEMPEDLHFPERQVLVSIRNSGTGPGGISRLQFSEGFPNGSPNNGGSGIFDDRGGLGEAEQKIIPVGQNETLYSSSLPFSEFETECSSEAIITYGQIQLDQSLSGQRIETDVEIHYSAEKSDGSCNVELRG